MSDSDSFINEVSEEVRRDRMFTLWRKYGVFVIGAVVAIVVAAGAKTWLDHQSDIAAQRAGGALLGASEGSPAEAAVALKALADETEHDGAATLARLRAAAALVASGEAVAAGEMYDEIAADSAVDGLLQDFAAFRAVLLRSADMSPEDAIGALSPFAVGGSPFQLLAEEARGLAYLKAGDRDAATQSLRSVLQDERAPNGLRQRVEAVMTAVGIAPIEEGDSEINETTDSETDGDANG